MNKESINKFIRRILVILLTIRVAHLIKDSFQRAETIYKTGKGEDKLLFAVNYIAKKTKMLPFFKGLLREVLTFQFEKHKDHINGMVIREPIVL